MFRKYYRKDERIDPITNFIFEYGYDDDTGLIERKGLNDGIAYLGMLILISILIFLFF